MKTTIITKTPFAVIKKTINDLVDFIKPTFGPSENKILISDEFRPYIIDDGVKIAAKFSSNNKTEETIINFVKAVSKKTNDRVGDGTTGSMILLQAIINELPDIFDSSSIVKELKEASCQAVEALRKKSKPIKTQKQLTDVAEVSCNNRKIAEIVSEVVYKTGHDGAISVEEGNETDTKHEITDGFQFSQGYVSPYMANKPEKMESVLNKAKVMVVDKTVGLSEMMPLMEKLVKLPVEQRKVLLIANDFNQDLISLLIVNNMKGVFDIVAVKSPGFGKERAELLKDVAAICDARVFDDQNKIEIAIYEDLGSAEKIVINQSETIIFKGAGDIVSRVNYLKSIKSDSDFSAQKIKDRIAKLSNGVAIIKAGGFTEEEMKSTREKIEDAVSATRIAYKSGVVPGAGVTLSDIKTQSTILNKALKAPRSVLTENMGSNVGGTVYDPTEVLIAAIESAVSIACLLIATKGILVTYEGEKL